MDRSDGDERQGPFYPAVAESGPGGETEVGDRRGRETGRGGAKGAAGPLCLRRKEATPPR